MQVGDKVLDKNLPFHKSMLKPNFCKHENDFNKTSISDYSSAWEMLDKFRLLPIRESEKDLPNYIAMEEKKNENDLIVAANKDLLKAIDELRLYGAKLCQEGAVKKGEVALKLAEDATSLTTEYINKTTQPLPLSLERFKDEFTKLINSKDKEMAEVRANWKTIKINIFIALTGVGALAIGVQLLVTRLIYGRPLFFFSNPKTTCEEKILQWSSLSMTHKKWSGHSLCVMERLDPGVCLTPVLRP